MTNSRAMKVVLALTTCSIAAGFVPRVPLVGKSSFAASSAPARSTSWLPSTTEPVPCVDPDVEDNREEDTPLKDKLITALLKVVAEDPPCLPQDSPHPDLRNKKLEEKRIDYQWSDPNDGSIFAGQPFLSGVTVPEEEKPGVPWTLQVLAAGAKIAAGLAKGRIKGIDILDAIDSTEVAKQLSEDWKETLESTYEEKRAEEMSDYNKLHSPPIKTPKSLYDFEDDDAFARNRLQGGNCITIEKCSATTFDKLTLSLAQVGYEVLKAKVEQLYLDQKLFVVDHELLDGMKAKTTEGKPTKWLAPCIALFEYVDDDADLLPIKPIGIQLNQGHAVDDDAAIPVASPIFTPDDSANGDTTWNIAKLCFEASDFIIHEVVSHLTYAHMVLEGPMVSMNRQLSTEHPINRLLSPHLEGTAYINLQAQEVLIVEGGAVDLVQANDITDSWTLCVNQLIKRISSDFSPEADFAARGVDKSSFPGRYMYRDVGTAYWEATLQWVSEYLDVYYTDDGDMAADTELQAFIAEMSSDAGGQMAWFLEYDAALDKKAFITKVIASYIYSATTLHAAVNFPQADSMSYSPSCPGAMYAEPPTDKTVRGHDEMMAYMQPIYLAASQVSSMTLLGSVHHTKLGNYPPLHFHDTRVHSALAVFMKSIEDIGTGLTITNAEIVTKWGEKGKELNDATNFAYTTLMPDLIPQSINI